MTPRRCHVEFTAAFLAAVDEVSHELSSLDSKEGSLLLFTKINSRDTSLRNSKRISKLVRDDVFGYFESK